MMQINFPADYDGSSSFSGAMMEAHRSVVLRLLLEGKPLRVIHTEIVEGIERILPKTKCSILLVSADGKHLTLGAAPSFPAAYNTAVDGIEIRQGAGSCGTAAYLNERVIVTDITTDLRWKEFKDAASAAGLASCWSQPVTDPKNRVIGTFAIYKGHSGAPDRTDLQVIEHASSLTSIAIERDRADHELKRYQHHLEKLVEERSREILHLNEELRAAADAAVAANAAKGTFLANMSHEIRTPMNAVLGLSFLIRDEATDPLQRQRIEKVITAGQHLLGTIDAILDLSKIDAGKFTLNEAAFRTSELVSSVVEMMKERASAKGLRLKTDIVGVPQALIGDEVRLKQSLINYIGNAIKFSNSGDVVVRARVIERLSDRVTVKFEIEDQGEGIEPEILSKLFSAFEQAGTSSAHLQGSTGLGLVITRRFAQLMGGDAGAESVPGQGSTFWFTVCLHVAKASPTPRDDASMSAKDVLRAEFSGLRVLLVEDEPLNTEISSAFLKAAGFFVDAASDGFEALELATLNRYALILMDMQMPRLGGLAATEEIRLLPAHHETPIIAMTANAFVEDQKRCLAAGMNGFITKPVLPNVLYSHILETLRGRGQQ
ncbi:response regulator [Paragemmobacter straminiformis]|uniref:histidine kinase n=1 Tax=Paragemmobacter straminiformis TaxID=2045119 RepID=A0A842I674_9RHOB|nr:response regulator [Gemmobacter straminiformis]MBC2835126.1 response regulator [Gemmobacter straminiformis]